MDDNLKVTIGERIAYALSAEHKKQKDLAQVLGVTDNTISYFVSGKRCPNVEQIVKIAEYLNTTPDFLLGANEKDLSAFQKEMGEYLGLSNSAIFRLWELSEDDDAIVFFDCLLTNDDFIRLLGLIEKYVDQCRWTELETNQEDYDAIRKGGKSLYERLLRIEKQDKVKKAVRESFGGDAVIIAGMDAPDLTLFQLSKLFLKIVDECRDEMLFHF